MLFNSSNIDITVWFWLITLVVKIQLDLNRSQSSLQYQVIHFRVLMAWMALASMKYIPCLSAFVNIFDTGESLVNTAMEIGMTYQWHILITNWVTYNNDNIDTWHRPCHYHCPLSPDWVTAADILSSHAKNQIKSRSQLWPGATLIFQSSLQ